MYILNFMLNSVEHEKSLITSGPNCLAAGENAFERAGTLGSEDMIP